MEWTKIEYEEGSNNTVIKKCYGTGELTIPQGVTKIGKRAFTTSSFRKVIIPETVEIIDEWAFHRCKYLQEVEINAKTIGTNAFRGCVFLTNITIGPSTKVISENAFMECTRVKEIVFQDGIETIMNRAFFECYSLEHIALPKTITKIGARAFAECPMLKTWTLDDDLVFNSWKLGFENPPQVINRHTLENLAKDLKPIATMSFAQRYVDDKAEEAETKEYLDYIKKNYKTLAIEYKENLSFYILMTNYNIIPLEDVDELLTIIEDKLVKAQLLEYKNKNLTPENVQMLEKIETEKLDRVLFGDSLPLEEAKKEWDFKKNKEGKYIITGYKGISTDIVIPDKIGDDEVIAIGEEAFSNNDRLTSVIISDGIKVIEKNAFDHCKSIVSISVPETIESIEHSAFNFCSSLISINIPKALTIINSYVFAFCSSLASVTLPEKLTTINSCAFRCCEKLSNLTIPETVTSIKDYAFDECKSFTKISLPEAITEIEMHTFAFCESLESIDIPETVTSIGENAFYSCYSLKSINISKNVEYIDPRAFVACKSLENIFVEEENPNYKSIDGNLYSKDGKILIQYALGKSDSSFDVPSIVDEIEDCAFSYCEAIKNINIPNNVTSVKDTFAKCPNLDKIFLSEYVENISKAHRFEGVTCKIYTPKYSYVSKILGYRAIEVDDDIKEENGMITKGGFLCKYNDNEENVTVPEYITHIGASSFSKETVEPSYLYRGDRVESNLKSISLPKELVSIGTNAFKSCRNLESIDIPQNVEKIGKEAFLFCSNLKSVKLPTKTRCISESAFSWTGITSIQIPEGVTIIEKHAFCGCRSLKEVKLPSTLKTIEDGAFKCCSELTSINIPKSVSSIDRTAFYECKNLTRIDVEEDNPNYKSIDGVLYSQDGALIYYPSAIENESFETPNDVTKIVSGAFEGIRFLKNIEFSKQVQSIDTRIFSYSSVVERIIVKGNPNISKEAFSNSKKLTYASLKEVTTLPEGVFFCCESLETVELSSNLESIEGYAFSSCKALSEIEIPQSVDSIDRLAFANTGLKTIVIPKNVKKIGKSAFTECKNIESALIGEGVTAIPECMFEGCEALTTITLSKNLTAVEKNAFKKCPLTLIKAPAGSYAYKYAKNKKIPIEING